MSNEGLENHAYMQLAKLTWNVKTIYKNTFYFLNILQFSAANDKTPKIYLLSLCPLTGTSIAGIGVRVFTLGGTNVVRIDKDGLSVDVEWTAGVGSTETRLN